MGITDLQSFTHKAFLPNPIVCSEVTKSDSRSEKIFPREIVATGFLKTTGHAVASYNLGPVAALHLSAVLTGPESKLDLEPEQGVFDPLAGPQNRKSKIWHR